LTPENSMARGGDWWPPGKGKSACSARWAGAVESMGKMLALAVTATMYGTVLANAIAGPTATSFRLPLFRGMISAR